MSNETEPYEQHFGRQTIRFEPPDVYVLHMHGPVSGNEIRELMRTVRDGSPGVKVFFILDLSDFDQFTPEAKQEFRETPQSHGIAIINATAQQRVVMTLFNKAYLMFNRGAYSPIEFFRTPEEARTWIEGRKKEIATPK